MAGKTRFAAKLALVTTVLSAGGAGAYYYTTTDQTWPSWLGGSGEQAAAVLIPEPNATATSLDAVASNWVGAAARTETERATMSTSARSAAETLAQDATAPPSSVSGDRYESPPTPTSALADAAEVLSEETEQQSTEEPTPTLAYDQAESAVEETETSAVANSEVEPRAAEPPAALARGQEPSDGDAEDFAAEADAASELPAEAAAEPTVAKEPPALELPESTPAIGAAARRARAAFRDEAAKSPAAAGIAAGAAAATAANGGRYGSAASAVASPEIQDRKADVPAPTINPFAAQSAAQPASAAGNTPGDVSSSLPPDGGIPLSGTPTAMEEQPPATASRAAQNRVGTNINANEYGGAPLEPIEAAPNSLGSVGEFSARAGDPPAGGIDGSGRPGERALEGPQRPALAIQKFAPPEIQVGKPAKFVVQVKNVGGQAADEVVIRDQIPAGTRLVSTSPTADNDGNFLVWQLGKLSVGEERTVEMQLVPTTEGEIGSVATVSYAAQASAKTRCTMPQLAIRMTAPSEVMIGAEQRVKIELRNPGTGDATNVMLFENVPANVRHAAGPSLEFEIGTLKAGETRELELVLMAEKAGKVENVLSARADGNLQVQQKVEFEVIAPALAVAVNGPERRYLERPATYEVIVENPGTAVAHDVQLITKLPKGMQFVRANNMGEYDAATHAVYWSLAELPQGETGTVELVAMPIETGPQTLQVEGRAQQGLADQTQQQVLVEGLAALMFEVRDLEDPIEVGGETGYEIRVVNQGTKSATNVRVAITLQPGLKVVSAEGEGRHTVQGGSIVFEPMPQLAPKADTVYRIKAQGVQAGDQRVVVEVATDDLGQPIRREESTRVFGDE